MNSIIKNIKEIYERGENIIEYIKGIEGRENNSSEDILISYDFQAGTYMAEFKKKRNWKEIRYTKKAEIISNYMGEKPVTLMEAGVGEASNLVPVVRNIFEGGEGD